MINFSLPHEVLMEVEKPARYIGNEINIVRKNPADVDIRFCFCFPDVYEVGMSNLGMQILYYFLNRRSDTYCERVFSPWHDMENKLRSNQLPLFSLETYSPIHEFDFIGFTVQYEMCYTNILNILDLANIPVFSADRTNAHPIIIAGGPCVYNPEPIAEFIDLFYLGEGEKNLDKLMDIYKENKKNGGTKRSFLEKAAELDGIYIPSFYDVAYHEDGTIKSFEKNFHAAKLPITKLIVDDLSNCFYPTSQIVPLIETVHDRVTLELFRGCIRGCRFCQAGFTYRPVRERNSDTLLNLAKELLEKTGHDEISLISLSTSDYTQLQNLTDLLIGSFSCDNISLSLPSMRIDSVNIDLLKKVQSVRKSSLTFAPEAGTQRLRDVINKNLTEETILNGCKLAFENGWDKLKLYFMAGLPSETKEDLIGIGDLSKAILDKYYDLPKDNRGKPVQLNVSVSCFVPKPFTPFQWEKQENYSDFVQKQQFIKKVVTSKKIKYMYHDAHTSIIEGALARGDRRVARVICNAWKAGSRFDGWSEFFKYENWAKAFNDAEVDPSFYNERKREYNEILPWDHINIGVNKKFLISEAEKAKREETTPDCRSNCSSCGIMELKGGKCFEI